MALNLTNNPIKTVGGVVKNIFAGFLPVIFQFKREDLQIISLGLGTGADIRLTIGTDLTTVVSIGDSLYLDATGISGYRYEQSGKVTAITATTIDVDIIFVESSASGYINYLNNWYLEAELVGSDNQAIKILPFSLKDDGDLAGNIGMDVSAGNDRNTQVFEFVSDEIEEARIAFKVQYRQIYDNSSEVFTLIDDELVLIFATKQPEHETFLNSLDEAEFYQGYPFGAILVHSKENSDDTGLNIVYDELNINQLDVTVDTPVVSLNSDKQGFIFANIDPAIVWDSTTEYIRLKASYSGLAFFDGTYFDNTFFETT